MTVAELIEKLRGMPGETRVFVLDECAECSDPNPRLCGVCSYGDNTWVPLALPGMAVANWTVVIL